MTQKAQQWETDRAIYRQLMEEVIAGIIDGTFPEGEKLPSVKQLAQHYQVHPLTVARAYRELGALTKTRRGIGIVVKEGVREVVLTRERQKFLKEEWPMLRNRIKRLEIDLDELLDRS